MNLDWSTNTRQNFETFDELFTSTLPFAWSYRFEYICIRGTVDCKQ